jgi:transposase-like protein
MKAKPQQKDLTLIQLFDRFGTEDKARKHLEKVIWKDGIVCPHCKCNDQSKFSSIAANPDAEVRAGLRFCSNCKKQFTVTIGTIFEKSHIPLRKWLIAFYLICSSKKGISALQLKRILELGSYTTALFLSHRIRHALSNNGNAEKLSGIIEADECLVPTGRNPSDLKRPRQMTSVVAMVERGGRVRSKAMATVSGGNLKQAIRDHVAANSELHTDSRGYAGLREEYYHFTVKHRGGEYSRREGNHLITTASVEGWFSLIKRGIIGVFHHVSAQHLPLYLAEFEHRHNCRKISDGDRTDLGLQKAVGKRLIYKTA